MPPANCNRPRGAVSGVRYWVWGLLTWLWVTCLPLAMAIEAPDSGPRLAILINGLGAKQLDVSSYLEIAPDPAAGEALLTDIIRLPDSAFSPLRDLNLFHTMGHRVFWIRGRIRQSELPEREHSNWMLVVENPHLRGSSLYISRRDQHQEPVFRALDAVEDRYLVYPLDLNPGDSYQFYIRLNSAGAVSAPAQLWEEQAYLLHKRQTLPGWGILFGGLAALIFYNLFLALSLRQPMYLYLAAFLGCSLLVTAYTEGFLNALEQPLPTWSWAGFGALMKCAALVAAVLFTRQFLATRQAFPSIDRWLQGALCCSLLLALVSVFHWLAPSWFFLGFMLCGLLFLGPAVVAALNVSDRASRYFLVGWSAFALGYAVYQMAELGLIPTNDLTRHLKELTLVLLGLNLSLGIASQIQKQRYQKQRGLVRQQETMLELKHTEEQIQKKVLRDTLRTFPNAQVLAQTTERMLAAVAASGESLTMVLAELHNLEAVEQQLGHAAKNELQTRATKRLSVVLRSISGVVILTESSDQFLPLAVLEGDRYAFLLRSMDDVAVNIAVDEVERAMQRPFLYQGIALQPGVSFGVARLTQTDEHFATLYQRACYALEADRQKNLGKQYQMQAVDQYSERNISLINQLRDAIAQGNITLYFQPVYDLRSDRACGIEVLTRWDTEQGQKISPSEIFYLAEVGGFVAELTVSVVEHAIRYYLAAVNPKTNDVRLSINLSPKCLREERFLEEVGMLLRRYQMPSKMLSFEIKEAAIIEDPSITRESLNSIRAMGVGLTIDEFGAAYSNYRYLSSLPVTEVKLDQRVGAALDSRARSDELMLLIRLCQEQDIKLVVHGVEDQKTLEHLEQLGCTFAQGHYFAAPVKASEFRLGKGLSLRRTRSLRV